MVDSPRAPSPPGAPAETPAAEEGAAPSRVPRWLLPALLAFVAAAAGIGGGFVVAPRVTAYRQAAASDTTTESEPAAEGGGGAEGEGAADRYYRIENLVINPAGSLGSHLLLVSVVFDIARAENRVRLESRDAEVRDRVATVLSAQTIEMLGAPSARDSLKRLIASSVAPLLAAHTPVQVFLPQFVIQ
jgi:flagellar basal body-associated protein FliL